MTERVDFKLRHVVVATFRYRHEAELAAGFLADAGIPYRLQIDDPALGMTITTPPTLWVRAVDLRAAREVLELDDAEPADEGVGRTEPSEGGRPQPADAAGPAVGDTPSAVHTMPAGEGGGPARLEIVRGAPSPPRRDRLSPRERLIALMVGLGAAAVAVVLPASGAPVLPAVLGAVAAAFVASALLARAPTPVARVLRALAGSQP